MNREIKFRAYNKDAHEWLRDSNEKIHIFGPINALANVQDSNALVIQQYTGVKDKDGKELFEGDIVEYEWERFEHDIEKSVGVIYFDEGVFYFGEEDEFAMNDSNFLIKTLKWLGTKVDLQ